MGAMGGSSANNVEGEKALKECTDLKKLIDQLRSDLKKQRDEMQKSVNQLLELNESKAGKEEVGEEIQNLHERIDALEKALAKSKSDLK